MAIWSMFQLLGVFFAICYMMLSFGILFPVSVYFIKKNLATLDISREIMDMLPN
jgi:hypothetical protein